MSTELFRKYIDLLNEAVSQAELDNTLIPALKELERILGKYRGKIFEDNRTDPPLFAPGDDPPSPSGPKPRIARLPGDSIDEYLARVRELSRSARGLEIGSGTPTTAGSLPSSTNPYSSMTEPRRASTGGTITTTPTGMVHTAPPPPRKGRVKLGAKLGAYTTAGLAALYAGYKGLEYLILKNSGYALRNLDTSDQEGIKKNFKILEPYVVPDVFKTLPADIQTRIDAVLDQLKKLGMAVTAGGDKEAQKSVAVPATAASAAAPAAEVPFSDILQNANRYVKGVRESVEPAGLSESEKMARLRNLVQENLPFMAVVAEVGIKFVQDVIDAGEYLGLAALIKKSPNIYLGIEALIKRFKTDVPAGTPKDFWKWLAKLVIPNKAEALALGIGAVGWAAYQWFQVNATVAGKDAVVNALTKDWPAENDALRAFKNTMTKMSLEQYNALSDADKDKIDETWIYYCSKFPNEQIGKQSCYDFVYNPKDGICTYHPDWAGCKSPSQTQ